MHLKPQTLPPHPFKWTGSSTLDFSTITCLQATKYLNTICQGVMLFTLTLTSLNVRHCPLDARLGGMYQENAHILTYLLKLNAGCMLRERRAG